MELLEEFFRQLRLMNALLKKENKEEEQGLQQSPERKAISGAPHPRDASWENSIRKKNEISFFLSPAAIPPLDSYKQVQDGIGNIGSQ